MKVSIAQRDWYPDPAAMDLFAEQTAWCRDRDAARPWWAIGRRLRQGWHDRYEAQRPMFGGALIQDRYRQLAARRP